MQCARARARQHRPNYGYINFDVKLLCVWSESYGTYAMTHCGTFLFSYRVRNACCATPIHTHTHGGWQRAIAVFVLLFLCMLTSVLGCNARSETMRANILVVVVGCFVTIITKSREFCAICGINRLMVM